MAKWRFLCLLALIALACACSLSGCGGSDDGGSEPPKTVASAGNERSDADSKAAGTTESGSGGGSTSHDSGEEAGSGATPPSGPAAVNPAGPGGASLDQSPSAALRHPKKPHKSPKSQSGGGPTAGLSPQEAATYETARALCANPDTLQYAPEDIRDDAEAMAKFAEGFAPAGEEQVVHDGCLVGLKSIGID
jgi:hypothetical protein